MNAANGRGGEDDQGENEDEGDGGDDEAENEDGGEAARADGGEVKRDDDETCTVATDCDRDEVCTSGRCVEIGE